MDVSSLSSSSLDKTLMEFDGEMLAALNLSDDEDSRKKLIEQKKEWCDRLVESANKPLDGDEMRLYFEQIGCIPFTKDQLKIFFYIFLNDTVKENIIKNLKKNGKELNTIKEEDYCSNVPHAIKEQICILLDRDIRWILYAHAVGYIGQNNGHLSNSYRSNDVRPFNPIYIDEEKWKFAAFKLTNCWENGWWWAGDTLSCWAVEATLGIHKWENDASKIPPNFLVQKMYKIREQLDKTKDGKRFTILNESQNQFEERIDKLNEKMERCAVYSKIFKNLSFYKPHMTVRNAEIFYGIRKIALPQPTTSTQSNIDSNRCPSAAAFKRIQPYNKAEIIDNLRIRTKKTTKVISPYIPSEKPKNSVQKKEIKDDERILHGW